MARASRAAREAPGHEGEAIAELGGRTFAYMVAKGFCDKDGEASLSSLVALRRCLIDMMNFRRGFSNR